MYETSVAVVWNKHFLVDACLFVVILDVVEPGSAAEKAFQKALGKGLPKVFAGPFARRTLQAGVTAHVPRTDRAPLGKGLKGGRARREGLSRERAARYRPLARAAVGP